MGPDELLIEAVKEYPFLYDTGDSGYHDNRRKDCAWQEISERFDSMTAMLCKKRWASLRDAFRKAYKMRTTSTGQTLKKRKPWRYEQQMAFVIPHLAEMERHETGFEIFSDTASFDSNSHFDIAVGKEDWIEKSVERADRRPTTLKTEAQSSEATPSKRKKRETPTPRVTQAFNECLQYKNIQPETQNVDTLTTFFKAIEETVRSFSPPKIIEAKRKIFALVNDLELRNWRTSAHDIPPASQNCQTFYASSSASSSPCEERDYPDSKSPVQEAGPEDGV